MPEPVTLSELKAFARIDQDDDDTLVESLGIAAREFVEQATGRDYSSAEATVPEKARLAIKSLAANWYEYREVTVFGDAKPVPLHVRSLLAQLRGGRLEPIEEADA